MRAEGARSGGAARRSAARAAWTYSEAGSGGEGKNTPDRLGPFPVPNQPIARGVVTVLVATAGKAWSGSGDHVPSVRGASPGGAFIAPLLARSETRDP